MLSIDKQHCQRIQLPTAAHWLALRYLQLELPAVLLNHSTAKLLTEQVVFPELLWFVSPPLCRPKSNLEGFHQLYR